MAPTPAAGYAAVTVGDLQIVVLGPDAARIDVLRKKWSTETKGRSLDAVSALTVPRPNVFRMMSFQTSNRPYAR